MNKKLLIPLITISALTLGACSLNGEEETTSDCGDNYALEFSEATVCLTDAEDHDFVEKTEGGNTYYENEELYVNSTAFVKVVSKEELEELPTMEEQEEAGTTTFSYQQIGIEEINDIEFVKLAHGYYPVGTEAPTEFSETGASITGYSYVYTIDENNSILFDAGIQDMDPTDWIEELIEKIVVK
jgi:hypothetical protein